MNLLIKYPLLLPYILSETNTPKEFILKTFGGKNQNDYFYYNHFEKSDYKNHSMMFLNDLRNKIKHSLYFDKNNKLKRIKKDFY